MSLSSQRQPSLGEHSRPVWGKRSERSPGRSVGWKGVGVFVETIFPYPTICCLVQQGNLGLDANGSSFSSSLSLSLPPSRGIVIMLE